MKAGDLERELTLLRPKTTTDPTGGETATWAALQPVWAAKQDIRDAERVRAQEAGSTVTTRFQIRWSPEVADVDERWEATCDGRRYAVAAVKEIGRREGLEITAAARSERT